MKFRERTLESGTKILLGKNEKNNDELMELYKSKSNTILHTVAPGSPFCVILKSKPLKKDVYEAAVACASKSQDWRDNKTDVKVHRFTGKDAKKPKGMKTGSWTVRNAKTINVKKQDIEKIKW
jgi:predicted ribosome quality control (RQC) complex YloA/Tae2 family protein